MLWRLFRRIFAGRLEAAIHASAGRGEEPSFPRLGSQLCTASQMRAPEYLEWCRFLKCEGETLHRKVWEYCYIMQGLTEQLGSFEGKRGLGFGVGRERLAEAFAALGAEVVATDQAPEAADQQGWAGTGQYANVIASLNRLKICDPAIFERRVQFRVADMNQISDDLSGFDFVWSACAFEHLGSIERGLDFVVRAMDCLKPGGVAVHTTEYNLTSNDATPASGATVLFRRRDIEELGNRLRDRGFELLPLNLHPGGDRLDHHVDVPPYKLSPHLRLMISRHAATSLGILIRRGSRPGTR
ncbi:MAG TPA: methyltransferase domain-containing protein [Polyangiaceae bacterium]|nr:methyltransferase domain-containing protein [Polyangiaceae bacterium]